MNIDDIAQDLDDLANDNFYDDLGAPVESTESKAEEPPDWVGNEHSTTYKAWLAINKIKPKKIASIKKCKKPGNKTAKSVYQMTKEDVSKLVGISAQSIFRTSSFSPYILSHFDDVNEELEGQFNRKKDKYAKTKNTGMRTHKKEQLVKSYQQLEQELQALKRVTTKELLDSVVAGMPLDLRRQLDL